MLLNFGPDIFLAAHLNVILFFCYFSYQTATSH